LRFNTVYMIQYSACPVCDSTQFSVQLQVTDYTVSQQQFQVAFCQNCSQGFTQNIPEQNAIGDYYKAESYISHTDSEKGVINKLYHIVRKQTLQRKVKLVKQVTQKQTGNILDIGCGTGAFLNAMHQQQWQVKGLEPDADTRARAKQLYGIETEPSHTLFNEQDGKYDAVTMWHVLEHVHELKPYLQKIQSILTANGKLIIAVPNYTSYDAQHYKAHWAAYDVPRHLYHFSPKSMEVLLTNMGFKLKAKKPMWFDSFYVSMLSEQYKNGKGNIIKAFFIGLVSNLKALTNTDKCSSVIYIFEK
jgi:2-polyprenyl-3-methyl-5-hydroxy-6-metoxy-1,4-benzoquinol methylase